jgi:hypothetical protein
MKDENSFYKSIAKWNNIVEYSKVYVNTGKFAQLDWSSCMINLWQKNSFTLHIPIFNKHNIVYNSILESSIRSLQ